MQKPLGAGSGQLLESHDYTLKHVIEEGRNIDSKSFQETSPQNQHSQLTLQRLGVKLFTICAVAFTLR